VERQARFETLFDATYEPLLAYARRRVRGEADDVVAEVMLVAWRRLDEVPEDEVAWLYGVARKVILGSRRSARRRAALTGRLLALPEPIASMERGARPVLLEALGSLSEPDREAILLVAWEGLDTRRAARAMGCSAPAFRVRLHRARRRLRAHLDDADEPVGSPTPATAKEGR
jgi:RNA polymerase sigma-70 factor (ECF subfamily)